MSEAPASAWYAHETYGRRMIVLHGRDARTWDGRGGWYYVGKAG